MRLLHTGDLHLGKKLEGKSRLDEQALVLDEIIKICDEKNVDVVLLCGDIFDTAIPSADAEELFFDKLLPLSKNRYVVAIAGNHDDTTRLCASSTLSKQMNIILIGDMDNSRFTSDNIVGGEGFIKITKNGETLNLATLPFPNETRMKEMVDENSTFTQKVTQWVDKCTSCFTPEGINVFMSHMFILGSATCDERELGTAKLLPSSVLPKNACYCALGHIHKPQTIIKDKAYYSGSILQYSFDDVYNKRVILVDTDGKNTKLESIALTSGKELVTKRILSFDDGMAFLDENPDKLVQLEYLDMTPLSTRQTLDLRKKDNFIKIVIQPRQTRKITKSTAKRSESELFIDFYQSKFNEKPSEELINMFLEVVNK